MVPSSTTADRPTTVQTRSSTSPTVEAHGQGMSDIQAKPDVLRQKNPQPHAHEALSPRARRPAPASLGLRPFPHRSARPFHPRTSHHPTPAPPRHTSAAPAPPPSCISSSLPSLLLPSSCTTARAQPVRAAPRAPHHSRDARRKTHRHADSPRDPRAQPTWLLLALEERGRGREARTASTRALPLLAGRPSPHLPSTRMLFARPFTRQHLPSPRLLSPQSAPLLWASAPPRSLCFMAHALQALLQCSTLMQCSTHAMQHTIWAEVQLLWACTQTRKSGDGMDTVLKQMPARARGQGEYVPLSPVFTFVI
jgi:hypothetical protein